MKKRMLFKKYKNLEKIRQTYIYLLKLPRNK